MSVWTWSLLQFVLVLTEKLELPEENEENSRKSIQSSVHEPTTSVQVQDSNKKLDVYRPSTKSNKLGPKTHSSNEVREGYDQPESQAKGNELSEIVAFDQNKNNKQLPAKVVLSHQVDGDENVATASKNGSVFKNNESLVVVKVDDHEEERQEQLNTSSNNNYHVSLAQRRSENHSSTSTYVFGFCDYFSFIFYNEIWSILTGILLQDGPFFIVRLIILLHYDVITHMNIFFTFKNIFVICLYCNRIKAVFKNEFDDWKADMLDFKNQKKLKNSTKIAAPTSSRFSRATITKKSMWRSLLR